MATIKRGLKVKKQQIILPIGDHSLDLIKTKVFIDETSNLNLKNRRKKIDEFCDVINNRSTESLEALFCHCLEDS